MTETSIPSKHAACMHFATTRKPKLKFKRQRIPNLKTDFSSNWLRNVEMKMKL
jgi:hypothetical protein